MIARIYAFTKRHQFLYGILLSLGLTLMLLLWGLLLFMDGKDIDMTAVSGFGIFLTALISWICFEKGMQLREVKREVSRLNEKDQLFQLISLREQVNPHFLFNALNILKSGAQETWVKDYVVQLAQVYRYLLNYDSELQLAPIGHEIEFIEAYTHILKERFESGLSVVITIPNDLKTRNIPPMALQILVENAIKHNVISFTYPLYIHIYQEENYLVVSNNRRLKMGRNPIGYSQGVGLKNLERRYRLIARQSIVVLDDEEYFVVKIPMI
ncbi:sensor histidine kinase [Dyadobacter helix]|uniref:sensor histidine kinase n=1 Tax=Dyadobacter helix TaxID=2822344 RepID=UPI001BFC423C|nr:histidine kinase [Dyadobacter sp. CECT 9275]